MVIVPFGPLLFKQLRVTGSATGGRGKISKMLKFAADHKIYPQVEVFDFESINTAIKKVEANEVRFRAVLKA
jgi:D-arabinose 1-dehydrogenase-like Zn-dependent alcohol dehydrogenase